MNIPKVRRIFTPYGSTISYIQSIIEKKLSFPIKLFPIKSENLEFSAGFLSEEIVYYLERRVPFRKIKHRLFKEIEKNKEQKGRYFPVKGIRISVSGRIGGRSKKALRSKTQNIKWGSSPLSAFSSKMDFACKFAKTRFGLMGVKVWICYE